jgi:polar amino acid transport system permease protein
MIVDWSYALSTLPVLTRAAGITVEATAAGFALALVLGLVLALARRAPYRPISWPVAVLIEFIRSTPLLVQLYFMYFIFPDYGIRLSALATGIVGLGLHYATYVSEVYRAGLDGVPRGQWEAATALNMSAAQTYLRVILPQAIPPVVPALGNYLVAMIKDTPLLSAITVVELMQAAKILGSENFRYLEPITLVGLFFLLFSLGAAALIRQVEARLSPDERPLP